MESQSPVEVVAVDLGKQSRLAVISFIIGTLGWLYVCVETFYVIASLPPIFEFATEGQITSFRDMPFYWLFVVLIPGILALGAFVTGLLAIREIQKGRPRVKGKWPAGLGLASGLLQLLMWLMGFLILR